MAIREKSVLLTKKEDNGDTTIIRPYTSIHNVKGGVAMINGIAPSENGNVNLPIVEDEEILDLLFMEATVTDQDVEDFINGLFATTEE